MPRTISSWRTALRRWWRREVPDRRRASEDGSARTLFSAREQPPNVVDAAPEVTDVPGLPAHRPPPAPSSEPEMPPIRPTPPGPAPSTPPTRVHTDRLDAGSRPPPLSPAQALQLAREGRQALHRPRPSTDREARPPEG